MQGTRAGGGTKIIQGIKFCIVKFNVCACGRQTNDFRQILYLIMVRVATVMIDCVVDLVIAMPAKCR